MENNRLHSATTCPPPHPPAISSPPPPPPPPPLHLILLLLQYCHHHHHHLLLLLLYQHFPSPFISNSILEPGMVSFVLSISYFEMKSYLGRIATGNYFEFGPILWQRFISRRRALSEALLLYCHSSESRSTEQAAWHLLQHLPKKAATWGLSEALYGSALIPPLIVRKTPALTWINDRAYCTTLLILHTGGLLSTCDVEEAVCKRDQATLLINSAPASSANEVKHRRCNLFQRKLASPACVALVCKEGRCGSEKGAWMIRRKALCSAHCSAGNGWSDTG